MQNQKIAQEILDFNKNAVKMSFDALSSFSDQTAKATDQLLEAVKVLRKEPDQWLLHYNTETERPTSATAIGAVGASRPSTY